MNPYNWKVIPTPYCSPDDPCYEIVHADKPYLSVTSGKTSPADDGDGVFSGLTKEHAERIVLCVRLLAGFTNEELSKAAAIPRISEETAEAVNNILEEVDYLPGFDAIFRTYPQEDKPSDIT